MVLAFIIHLLAGIYSTTLSHAEARAVRNAIYVDQRGTFIAPDGKYARQEVLDIPASLEEVYHKKPAATLNLLAKVIEGASPVDSAWAAACAISLCDGHPGAGAAVMRVCRPKTYDFYDEDWECTPREHNLYQLDRLRRENKKGGAGAYDYLRPRKSSKME